jgi:hypothetical protein
MLDPYAMSCRDWLCAPRLVALSRAILPQRPACSCHSAIGIRRLCPSDWSGSSRTALSAYSVPVLVCVTNPGGVVRSVLVPARDFDTAYSVSGDLADASALPPSAKHVIIRPCCASAPELAFRISRRTAAHATSHVRVHHRCVYSKAGHGGSVLARAGSLMPVTLILPCSRRPD